ncbi:MAG TPA: acyl-CoA dehydrogenase family protein [Streptosporangiaceae bacterium]|nr:acyl-CoA dehydrogenase family protein [Streptosporangiaceae bacterium]
MAVARAEGAVLTRTEAVERSRSLFPLMRRLAREADDNRHLLPEMVAAFSESGLIRTLVPRRWGGSELDLTTHMEIAIELGRAYGSMAWVASFLIDHPFILAHFEDEAQHDVWGVTGPDTLIATSFAPVGKVTAAPGGWILSGDWSWASGVGYAQWIMIGGMVPDANDHGEYRLFLVPLSELRIVDTWYSSGLRGSGSDNVIADGVFVPEYRTVAMSTLLEARSPGGKVNPAPLYNQPFMAHGGHAMVSPAIGIARGMVEAWQQHVRSKTHSHTQEQVSAAIPMQLCLAEAAVRIDSAELLLRRCLAMVDSGAQISLEDRVRNRRDVTYVGRILVRAVEDLMQMAGASALRDDSPIQRGWRDVRAISCHVFCNFNAAAENYGRMAFGYPLNPRDAFV